MYCQYQPKLIDQDYITFAERAPPALSAATAAQYLLIKITFCKSV